MASPSETAVAALLREAEAAHGVYETNALGGVFDVDWPRWYASFLLDHGLAEHLSGANTVDADRLAAALQAMAADYERARPAVPWPEVYARRLVAGGG